VLHVQSLLCTRRIAIFLSCDYKRDVYDVASFIDCRNLNTWDTGKERGMHYYVIYSLHYCAVEWSR